MANYDVQFEWVERYAVTVDADNEDEAKEQVLSMWNDGQLIFSDHDTNFIVTPNEKETH